LAFREIFTNHVQGNILYAIFAFMNGQLEFPCEFRRCLDGGSSFSNFNRISSSSSNNFFLNFSNNIWKEPISTNSFSEPGVQCSRKLNLKKGQEEKPF
jgi:hypothetical protein